MSVTTDQVQTHVQIEGQQAINELGKLEAQARKAQKEMDLMNKRSKEYREAKANYQEVEGKIKSLRSEIGVTGMTLKQLRSYQKELTQEMTSGATRGTAEYEKLKQKLQEVKAQQKSLQADFQLKKQTSSQMADVVKGSAIGSFVGIGVQQSLEKLLNIIPDYVSSLKKVSDQQANVMKTTNLTEAELAKLEKGFKNLDTRTPREQLRSLAAEAGKLGREGVDAVQKFVKEGNIIGVALQADLGEDAVVTIAKAADAYKEGMLNIASGINEVGARSAATERYQVDFLERMTGIANTAKLRAGDVLGYASALEVNGVQAETSSTALSQFFIDFVKNSDKFEKAAGMQKGALKQLLQDKGTNEAFITFLENLNKGSKGTKDMLQKLEELGIDGARGAQTFLVMANNTKQLREQQEIANSAIREGSSVIKEYEKNNNNFAGNLEKIGNRLANTFRLDKLNSGLKDFVGWLEKATRVNLSETLQKESTELETLRTRILSTKIGTEQRTKAIKELQEKYPEYLGNLNAEKASNEEVSRAIDKVTSSLVAKIVVQKKQEEIQENAEAQAEIQTEILEEEEKMLKILTGIYNQNALARKARNEMFKNGTPDITTQAQIVLMDKEAFGLSSMNSRLIELGSILPKIKDLQKQRSKAAIQGMDLEMEKMRMMEALGMQTGQTNTQNNGRGGGIKTEGVDSEESKKEADKAQKEAERRAKENAKEMDELRKHLAEMDNVLEAHGVQRELSSLEKRDKELALIDQKFQAEILKAGQYQQQALNNDKLTYEQKLAAEKDFQTRIDLLEEEWRIAKEAKKAELDEIERVKKEEVKAQIELALMSDQEREIEQVKRKYEELIALAETYGISTLGIYEAMYTEIDVKRKKNADSDAKIAAKTAKVQNDNLNLQMQNIQTFYGGVSDILQFSAAMSDDMLGFQQAVAVAEIIFKQAQAIANIMLAGSKAEAQTPSFGARMSSQILATMGVILSGFAQAASVVHRVERPNMPSFYFGGPTGKADGSMGGDQYGKFVGAVHEDEYVIPAAIRRIPAVINAERVIEAVRINNGYSPPNRNNLENSGATNMGSEETNSGGGSSEVDMLILTELRMMRSEMQDKKVVFTQSDYDDFIREQDKIKFLAQG